MITNIKDGALIVAIIAAIVFAVFLFKKETPETIMVPVKIEVPVPGKDGKSDTIYMPSPIKENPINADLLKKYSDAKDTIAKLELYKEAVTERIYDTIYKDSTQNIEVYSKVQGKLLEQAVSYSIFPTTIPVDIEIEVPIKKVLKVFLGGEVILPVGNPQLTSPAIKGNLMIMNKKENIMSFGYDSKGNLYAGYNIKL